MDILIEVDKREGRSPGEASDPPNRKQVFTNDRIVISLFIVDRRILLERGDFSGTKGSRHEWKRNPGVA